MTRFRVLPYRQGSKGAKALAEALGGKVLKLEGSKFVAKGGDIIINWGMADENNPTHVGAAVAKSLWDGEMQLYNNAGIIRKASNKLLFFKEISNVDDSIIPKWWTSKEDIPDDCFPIVCRTVLAGHSGEGIVIADSRDDLVAAPLYVQYIKKKDEYRVHVGKRGDGSFGVICVQRKAKRHDATEVDWRIRNHAGGFIFQRNGFTWPAAVESAALQACEAVGLTFGAVDVIWNDKHGKAYVLEVNTAPGLEGQTVIDYANYFKELSNAAG